MSTSPDCTFTSERAQQRLARVLDALKDGGLTKADIAARSFMSSSAANLYIFHLKQEPKLIYRSGWDGNKPIYSLGDKKDVSFPKRTRKQRYHLYIKKKPEKHAQKLERARKKYWKTRDATQLVGIDRRQPPLVTQIENYVIVNRHKTTGQVAKALDAKPASVSSILRRLQGEGKVRAVTLGDTRFKWESAIHALPAVLDIPKQTPFSALFLSK